MPDRVIPDEHITLPSLLRQMADRLEAVKPEHPGHLGPLPGDEWREFRFSYRVQDTPDGLTAQTIWIDDMSDVRLGGVIQSTGQEAGQETL